MRIATRGIPKKAPQPSPFTGKDFASQFFNVQQLVAELESIKAKHDKTIADSVAAREEIERTVVEFKGIIKHTVSQIKKGDSGADAPVVDEAAMAQRVLAQITIPKAPTVDEEKIAQRAASLIVIPKPRDGKTPIVDHGAIVEEVFKQLDGGKRKLSIKHLKDFNEGLEQTIAPIRHLAAGFGGGGDSVTAGTNVTISTNSAGIKVISASGGSGFTTLDPTEVPDGSRTTFTFAAATAKPSYIIADNVWMKATTKAGTVNWTWNNSTKVATMSIPPNDDIEGIV